MDYVVSFFECVNTVRRIIEIFQMLQSHKPRGDLRQFFLFE